jgi:NitT/TauT family transport system substrate-binding protein
MRALLVLAAALAAAAPAFAADKVIVGKPIPNAFSFAISDVGVEAGIFKKYDLDIERITLQGGAKIHQAMIAGSIDIGLSGGPDFGFLAKGAKEKAVAAMAGAPLNMIVAVRADNSFPTPASLKGGSIGVSTPGSLAYWCAQEFSRRQGWGPDGMKIVSTGGPTGSTSALMAKNLDSMVTSLEGGLQLEAEGRAKTLVVFGDYIKSFVTHAIFATEDMMEKRPDVLRRYLKGWFDTVAFVRANKDEAVRIISKTTGLSPEVTARSYDLQISMYSTDGRFDREAVRVVKQSLIDMGQLDSMPPDEKLFTEKFLPSAKPGS